VIDSVAARGWPDLLDTWLSRRLVGFFAPLRVAGWGHDEPA